MTSNRAINSSFTQHNESSSSSLLQILIHEIAKDGGVTLVNSLPTSNPLISTHLSHNRNNKEKLKLVAFLKAYPHIFQVDDNNGNDPIVIVRLLEFELEFDSHTDREGKEFDKMKVEARKKLANKTMYELQKRLSKYERRCKLDEKKGDCLGANNDADGNGDGDVAVASRPSRTLSEWTTSNTIPGAQIEWLTKKVQKELHVTRGPLPNIRGQLVWCLTAMDGWQLSRNCMWIFWKRCALVLVLVIVRLPDLVWVTMRQMLLLLDISIAKLFMVSH